MMTVAIVYFSSIAFVSHSALLPYQIEPVLLDNSTVSIAAVGESASATANAIPTVINSLCLGGGMMAQMLGEDVLMEPISPEPMGTVVTSLAFGQALALVVALSENGFSGVIELASFIPYYTFAIGGLMNFCTNFAVTGAIANLGSGITSMCSSFSMPTIAFVSWAIGVRKFTVQQILGLSMAAVGVMAIAVNKFFVAETNPNHNLPLGFAYVTVLFISLAGIPLMQEFFACKKLNDGTTKCVDAWVYSGLTGLVFSVCSIAATAVRASQGTEMPMAALAHIHSDTFLIALYYGLVFANFSMMYCQSALTNMTGSAFVALVRQTARNLTWLVNVYLEKMKFAFVDAGAVASISIGTGLYVW